MPESKKVAYGEKSVVVSRATTLVGLRRTRLIITAGQGEPDTDPDVMIARRVLYPAMVAAVTAHEGFEQWPPPFEEFLEMDEEFITPWEQAVFDLNPHWLAQPETPETVTGEKKQPMG